MDTIPCEVRWCPSYTAYITVAGCEAFIGFAQGGVLLLQQGIPSGALSRQRLDRIFTCGRCPYTGGRIDYRLAERVLQREYEDAFHEIEDVDWERWEEPWERRKQAWKRYRDKNREARAEACRVYRRRKRREG